MKLKAVSGIMLTLLYIGILTLAFNAQSVKSDWSWTETIYIRADGSVDPDTAPISSVDNVTYIFTDTINESVVVERDNIVVDGAGYILQGTGDGNGIYLQWKNNVTIKRVEVKGFYSGICLNYSSYCFVSQNKITSSGHGIDLYYSSNNVLTRNNVSLNNFRGISLVNSSNNIVSGNFISRMGVGGYVGIGVYLSDSNECTISNNTAFSNSNNGLHLAGTIGSTICNNNVTSNGNMGMAFGVSSCIIANNTVTGSGWYGIHGNSYYSTISGNTLTKNRGGIIILQSYLSTLRDNRMFGNSYNFGVDVMSEWVLTSLDIETSNTVEGKPVYYWINQHNRTIPDDAGYVAAIQSSNITVKGLDLEMNFQGVLFAYTTNSTILNNNMSGNRYGIHLHHSGDSNISRNRITGSSEGIELHASDGCAIIGNTVTENWRGISISASRGCVINKNNITHNSYGMGIFWPSSGNIIYHNNFIGNVHGQVLTEKSAKNEWDAGYPSGGNFWSDYAGVDLLSGPFQNETGKDVIGDTPHIIDGDHRDTYPLMCPYGSFPSYDVNEDGIVDIGDVVDCALAFGTKPGSPHWNPKVDITQDGLVDIFDLVIIGISYGTKQVWL